MSELEALMQDHYDLKCVHGESVLTQSGFTLIATICNEKYFLGEFLRHYRWLGVSRFLFVDDGSTDGSVEFCSEQSDVAIFTSERYRYGDYLPSSIFETISSDGLKWRVQNMWKTKLMHDYCVDKWALVVDLDEFIVIPPRLNLTQVCGKLEAAGQIVALTPMVDVYPRTLEELKRREVFSFGDAWYHDAVRHCSINKRRGIKNIYSGARARLIEQNGLGESLRPVKLRHRIRKLLRGNPPHFTHFNNLTKYSLIKWSSANVIFSSHRILGVENTKVFTALPLLHFKFTHSVLKKTQEALQRRQYWSGSTEYEILQMLLVKMEEKGSEFTFTHSKATMTFDALQEEKIAFWKL